MERARHGTATVLAFGALVASIALLVVLATDAAMATPPDDYEWRPPIKLNDEDQVETGTFLMRDGATGEVYMLYTAYDNVTGPSPVELMSHLAVFDDGEGTFTDVLEYGAQDRRDALVHNGTLYRASVYAPQGTVSLTLNDDDTPTEIIRYDADNIVLLEVKLLEVRDGKLLMLTLRSYNLWYPDYEFHFHVEYLEVPLDTYVPVSTPLFTADDRLYDNVFIEYVDGTGYVFWQPEDNSDNWIYCYSYDTLTGTGEGPTAIHENTGVTTDEYWWPHVDPMGDYHLFFGDQGPKMCKYSSDGTSLGTLDLTGTIMTTSTPYFGWFPVIVNETGYVYVFHYNAYNNYIRVLVVDPDYSTDTRIETIANGEFDRWALNVIMDGSDRIMVVWAFEEFEIKKIWYSYQTALTPDLEVDPATFRFSERHTGQEEGLSFSVRNMGRAVASSFTVNVTWKKADTDVFGIIGGKHFLEPVPRMGSVGVEFPTDLPGGNYLISIEIVEVMPLENNVRNNVFEAWVNVKNKAPELVVTWPHDGQFVDDTLDYQGFTSDREDPDDVMTFIDIPGGAGDGKVTGSGDWNLTVDVSDVPSGAYKLTISAFDGELYTSVSLTVWVDHPEETLQVWSFSPPSDVQLIVGEGQAFSFEASDLFGRPIGYTWSMDGTTVSEGVTSFAYIAEEAGEHTLLVEATNTHHTVYHEWSISVRVPIAPTISPVLPEGDVTVLKGASVDFQVAVDNPDGRTYHILWSLDGFALEGGDALNRTHTFQGSGDHLALARLVANEGISTVEWTITVKNRVPEITVVTPESAEIDITQVTDMTFRIEAEDPDGDDLSFAWSSTGLDLRDLAGPEGLVSLPCDDDAPYTISVTVTDGEDEVTWAWTVRPDPPDPPVNHAPVLTSAQPSDDPVVIHKATTIDYAVEVTDEDGDTLTYVWGSSLVTMDGRNASSYSVDCPCDEEGEYTVWVTVSDGEHEVTAEWTVKAEPQEESPDMQNGHLPWVAIVAVVLVACTGAIVYIYWIRTKDGR